MKGRLSVLFVNGQSMFFTEEQFVDGIELEDIDATSVRNAIRKLGYNGKSASIVYGGRNIAHLDVDVPPMDASNTQAFLRRRMGNTLSCDANGMLAFVRTASGNRILADVLDSSFYRNVRRAFSANGISVDLISSLAVPLMQIAEQVDSKAPVLVCYGHAASAMSYMLYYDEEKKAPALFREAPISSTPAHVTSDMNRSLGLGKQFFGGVEPELVLVGDWDENLFADATHIGKSSAFLDVLRGMPVNSKWNMVPKEDRRIRTQNLRMRLGFGIIGIFVGMIMGGHFYLQHTIKSLQKSLTHINEIQNEASDYIREIQKFEKINRLDDAILNDKKKAPFLLLQNIGNQLNPKIVLTEFTATDGHSGSISFSITGRVNADPLHAPDILRMLEQQLQDAPFHAEIIKSWKAYWLKAVEIWSNATGSKKGIPFIIEGVLHE